MTEDEAKTKWCPFARIADPNAPTGGNTYINKIDGVAPRCIGSDCMAWRSKPDKLYERDPDKYPLLGYCGLAGTPS